MGTIITVEYRFVWSAGLPLSAFFMQRMTNVPYRMRVRDVVVTRRSGGGYAAGARIAVKISSAKA